jgi:hypothetical protein
MSKLIEGKTYARKCDATGKGINKGYCFGDGEMYFKYEKDLIKYLRSQGDETFNDASDEFILNESYQLDEYYWTEWDEDDHQYIVKNGELVDIDEQENEEQTPIGYNAAIKFDDSEETENVYIKVGSFDDETATEQERLDDEKVFFYIDSPEQIETLKTKGVNDFIVITAESIYK